MHCRVQAVQHALDPPGTICRDLTCITFREKQLKAAMAKRSYHGFV
jgi:hypothetical protein